MKRVPVSPFRKRLPVSSRIFFAAATLAAAHSAYLDHGFYWEAVVAIAAVILIVLVRRHQWQEDEQYSKFFVKHPNGNVPPTRR